MNDSIKTTDSSRSWFCVLNNPEKIFEEGITPEQIVDKIIELWTDKPSKACAVNYEIGDNGTPHCHMVLEDKNKSRFSAVQKLFPSIHIEPTKGNKKQAKAYIEKQGKFEEKNHTIVVAAKYHGDIEGKQGKRNDLLEIEDFINAGMTPNEIMDMSITYRKHETLIRKTYFAKRYSSTPVLREVKVYWHVGKSGTGKSYTYVNLCEEHTQEQIYMMNDYDSGGFDMYMGEPILFMDEFKGGLRFQVLLNLLEGYRMQIHARYANSYALWNEVHISSIFPPEKVYRNMVDSENRTTDPIKQLMRRIDEVVYHYKIGEEYKTYTMNGKMYKDYDDLLGKVYSTVQLEGQFVNVEDEDRFMLPFPIV
ncbi:MAG: hypothetical protein K9L62_12845 [Vallitaleaceae bacterium]|nr:hypothetical protein [Vallitaleaceae bacterium]